MTTGKVETIVNPGAVTFVKARPEAPEIPPRYLVDFAITHDPGRSGVHVPLNWQVTLEMEDNTAADLPYSQVEAQAFAALAGQIAALAENLAEQLREQQADDAAAAEEQGR